jgi:uncharacterized membrane protein
MKPNYIKTNGEKPLLSLTIWPHRSCSKKTFLLILAMIGFILIVPTFLFLNISFALSILPFSLLSILLLFFVGNKNFNDALLTEKLKIYPKKNNFRKKRAK